MNRKQRIIWSDNGTLKDLSRPLNDFRSESFVMDFVGANDALYIGTELPFNSRYIEIGTANTADTTLSISVWDGSAWIPTKDLVDGTKTTALAAKSLAQSGIVSFALDRDNSNWGFETASNDVTGLSGTYIYDLYWSKWTWSADWFATTSLGYIGSLYSDDDDLATYYPDTANSTLKDGFETGKTDWKEQAFAAAEAIERDLRRRNVIMRREQIFDTSLLLEASVHKTAEIIYGGLGSAYAEAKAKAAKEYSDAISMKHFEIDRDGDGILSHNEKASSLVWMTR